jgi:hypothetical protein
MYSIVLVMASMTAQEVPAGRIFHRGGCNGNGANVRVVTRINTDAAPRERVHLLGWFVENKPVRTIIGSRALGCAGGSAATANVQTSVNITTSADGGVTTSEAAALGDRLTRAAVHRQLRVALRSQTLTPEQAIIAQKALANSDVYEYAVSKIHLDLRNKAAVEGVTIQKFGDGAILKMLLDNLPQIIQALTEILKLFHIGMLDLPFDAPNLNRVFTMEALSGPVYYLSA